MFIYANKFLAIFLAFKKFGYVRFLVDPETGDHTNRKQIGHSLFQAKFIRPTLWNACDSVIQFNFTNAHIPGKNNTAADYLSRLEICP